MRDIGRERASDAAGGLVVSSRPRRLSFASVSTTQVYPSSCSSPFFLWPAQQQNRGREEGTAPQHAHRCFCSYTQTLSSTRLDKQNPVPYFIHTASSSLCSFATLLSRDFCEPPSALACVRACKSPAHFK